MQYFDLSHSMENGMTFFPGDPEPHFVPADIVPPWRVTQLHIGTHTGTHIDAPAHFLPHGKTIDQYPPEWFLVAGIVVPALGCGDDEPIGRAVFAHYLAMLPVGGVVLVRTGWDRYWGNESYMSHPYLSHEAADLLVKSGAGIVGVDTLSVDSTVQGTEHAHATLLGNETLIVENLARLDQLTPGKLYSFAFLPLKLAGLDGSPVRAVAWRED